MSYPGFPVAGAFPLFLNPCDPSFHSGAYNALYVGAGSAAGQIYYGTYQSPNDTAENALLNSLTVDGGGHVNSTHMVGWAQRVGPRFAFWMASPGGTPE